MGSFGPGRETSKCFTSKMTMAVGICLCVYSSDFHSGVQTWLSSGEPSPLTPRRHCALGPGNNSWLWPGESKLDFLPVAMWLNSERRSILNYQERKALFSTEISRF